MTTCNDCGEMLRFSERMGITRHKCDPEIIAAQVAQQNKQASDFRLARARERQARIERYNAQSRRPVDDSSPFDNVFTPTYTSSPSSSYSSSCSDSSSYSSSDSSSSCDSGSSSSD